MLLLIDNYDSFVYNLARYFEELGCETVVVRNDAIDVEGAQALCPEAIVISPGPCTPKEAGVSIDLIRKLNDIDSDPRRLSSDIKRSPQHLAAT